ncbi:MAG: hypothetical protein Q9188_002405 [Gyalolechia gomerana]
MAKHRYDSKHTIDLAVGSKAYLRLFHGYTIPGLDNKKFSQHRAGPFPIKRKVGKLAYELELPPIMTIQENYERLLQARPTRQRRRKPPPSRTTKSGPGATRTSSRTTKSAPSVSTTTSRGATAAKMWIRLSFDCTAQYHCLTPTSRNHQVAMRIWDTDYITKRNFYTRSKSKRHSFVAFRGIGMKDASTAPQHPKPASYRQRAKDSRTENPLEVEKRRDQHGSNFRTEKMEKGASQ